MIITDILYCEVCGRESHINRFYKKNKKVIYKCCSCLNEKELDFESEELKNAKNHGLFVLNDNGFVSWKCVTDGECDGDIDNIDIDRLYSDEGCPYCISYEEFESNDYEQCAYCGEFYEISGIFYIKNSSNCENSSNIGFCEHCMEGISCSDKCEGCEVEMQECAEHLVYVDKYENNQNGLYCEKDKKSFRMYFDINEDKI